jgi:putative ABC transport system permease protein
MLVRSIKSILYLLWGGAAFVLLIGGVNIANLALARSSLRMKEISTRLAIGASRAQVARQLLIESLILGVAGGALGIVVGSIRALATIGLDRLPRANEIHIDATVIGAAMALSIFVGSPIRPIVPAILKKARCIAWSPEI